MLVLSHFWACPLLSGSFYFRWSYILLHELSQISLSHYAASTIKYCHYFNTTTHSLERFFLHLIALYFTGWIVPNVTVPLRHCNNQMCSLFHNPTTVKKESFNDFYLIDHYLNNDEAFKYFKRLNFFIIYEEN